MNVNTDFHSTGKELVPRRLRREFKHCKLSIYRTFFTPLSIIRVIIIGMRLLDHDRVQKCVQYFI